MWTRAECLSTREQRSLHLISHKLPPRAQEPPAGQPAEPLSVRDSPFRTVYIASRAADVQGYRRRAGLDQRVHPHLFRHQMLSHLTAQGLTDSQIQLISGHESKRSLEVYQHLSLEQVERAYQAAVRDLDV